MKPIDFKTLDPRTQYRLMISAIVPRPIAFVSSISSGGIGNLAPFSFFSGVSSNPPCIVFSATRKPDGEKKDTLKNIEQTQEFVVHVVTESLVPAVNQCAAEYPYGVDEMQKVGLTPLPSVRIKPHRVKESPVHMECKLYKTFEVGDGSLGSSVLIVGEIVYMHIEESLYKNDSIDVALLNPASRLGGISYGLTREVWELARPQKV